MPQNWRAAFAVATNEALEPPKIWIELAVSAPAPAPILQGCLQKRRLKLQTLHPLATKKPR